MEKSAFGARLRTAFQNANNAQIARKIGVGPSTVVNYMAGRIPELPIVMKIKSVTGCDLDWLLTGDGKPAAPAELKSLEEVVRGIVRDELRRAVDGVDGVDEMDVVVEPAEVMVAPVVARISGGERQPSDEREQIRRTISGDDIGEIEKRIKPRKRKTG